MILYYMQTLISDGTKICLIDEILYNKIEKANQNQYKLHSRDNLVNFYNENQPVMLFDPILKNYVLCYLRQYKCTVGRFFTVDIEKYYQVEK